MRIEDFRVLMNNYDNVKKYADASVDSVGSAEKKFADYNEGIESSMNSFKTNFEGLSQSIFNSKLLKGTVDTGSGFLGVLTWLTKTLGSIPLLAGLAAGAISGIANKGKLNVHMPFATDGNINRVKYENGVFNKGLHKQILQNGLYRRILSSTDYNVDGKALSA